MTNPTSTPGLSLLEAITRMLQGEVMVDKDGEPHKAALHGDIVYLFMWGGDYWRDATAFIIDGWRVATPEELAEIERQ